MALHRFIILGLGMHTRLDRKAFIDVSAYGIVLLTGLRPFPGSAVLITYIHCT
jgi:hypothetical protein